MVHEYGSSEAGQAAAVKGFTAVAAGGLVVLRLERFGVVADVLDVDTGMAPRMLTDAVEVRISRGYEVEDALVMKFGTLSAFLATLE